MPRLVASWPPGVVRARMAQSLLHWSGRWHFHPSMPQTAQSILAVRTRLKSSAVSLFGEGPVRPLVALAEKDARFALEGTFRFVASRHGWYVLKTLWFATPEYKGPILIRGRQLDGENPLAFGEGPQLLDPQLARGKTLNGGHGFRTWPGGTWVRAPGCYGWQVDGRNFSRTIVFRAELV